MCQQRRPAVRPQAGRDPAARARAALLRRVAARRGKKVTQCALNTRLYKNCTAVEFEIYRDGRVQNRVTEDMLVFQLIAEYYDI